MSSKERGDEQPGIVGEFQMRARCKSCDSPTGYVEEIGAQDVVRCICGVFQYNAPRTETGKPQRPVSRGPVDPKLRAEILIRANKHCELCGRPTERGELHVSHLLSTKDGSEGGVPEDVLNSEDNLAAFCANCNLGLGPTTVPVKLVVAILMARLRRQRGTEVGTVRGTEPGTSRGTVGGTSGTQKRKSQ